MASARYFLLLLSKEALDADWPKAEQSVAIYSDPSGRLGRVIPVLVKPCKLPPLLAFRRYVDLRDPKKVPIEMKRLIAVLTNRTLDQGEASIRLGVLSQPDETRLSLTDAFEPDEVSEKLYCNLFPVKNLPRYIWSAPTTFRTRRRVFSYFGRKTWVPAFILKKRRIYTFVDLSSEKHLFLGVTEDYDVQSKNTHDWLSDETKRRWLIELLNDSIRSHAFKLRLSFDKVGKKYYYPQGVLKSESIAWTPHVRRALRSLVIERKRDDRTVSVRHRAISLHFDLLSDSIYLRLEQGLVFTYDGTRIINGIRRGVLSTRYLSRQRNLQAFGETRFWAWLLSDDGKTIRIDLGGTGLEIDAQPVSIKTHVGIFGDTKEIPEEVESPPELIEAEADEEEMTEYYGEGDDELEQSL